MECVVRVSSRWWEASLGPTLTTAARETSNSYDGHSLYQHWYLIICIHQSWFIWYQQLPSVLLIHHACYSLFLQTATVCSQHTFIILLHQADTTLTTQQTVPVWYCQHDINMMSVDDNSLIQLWYQTVLLRNNLKQNAFDTRSGGGWCAGGTPATRGPAAVGLLSGSGWTSVVSGWTSVLQAWRCNRL